MPQAIHKEWLVMPRRWFGALLLTAVCNLFFLPMATRGAETGVVCYVAAIESRPWNGPAGGPGAATGGDGLRGDRHGARLGDTWIQSGPGGNDETWLVLDLQGCCDLEKLVLWNYFEFGGNEQQNATLPDRGVASADIYVATAESGARIPRNGQGVFNFKAAGWELIRPNETFHKAPVAQGPDHTIEPTDVIDLTGHQAVTHVALARMKHFARDAFGDYVGLDEIRIVPVAGTYVEDPDRPHAELRAAAALGAAADSPRKYQELLKSQGAAGLTPLILAAYGSQFAEPEIEKLSKALAASSENASAMLDALAAENSVKATSVSAELLYGIAAQIGGRRLTDDAGWRHFAEKGAALLEHDDPFVRSMAAWALTRVRDVNQEIGSRPDTPDWMAKCLALEPETSLECDFVLQAIGLGDHRTTRGLSRSAEDLVRRAEELASYAQSRGARPQRQRVAAALERLKEVYGRGAGGPARSDLAACRKWWMDVRLAAREVVLAGPDMDFGEVVFFKAPVRTEGNHPDGLVQNHDRPKERRPGGDVFVQAGMGLAGAVRPLIAGRLGPGHVQDMDLWWNADRLVFAYVPQPRWGDVQSSWGSVSWRNGPTVTVFDHVVGFRDGVFWEKGSEPTHLYEINLDGTGLRQLTDDKLYCDREPAYLPNGDVVFSSDRGCGASQCGAAPLAYSDFGLPNLFRVSADGNSVERLTYNKDVDRYPHCLGNGLIGYMRWDYQERFWQWPHSLWTIRPDGTRNDALFKAHFNDPQSVREPRSIPGSGKLVVIATGHHAPPEGAVAVVDPSLGVNNPEGLRYVTPSCSPLEGGLGSCPTVAEGGVPDRGGLYRTPWPLSEKGFLVAYAYHYPGNTSYAAYYIDVWGNKELIHRDRAMDVLCPMPVRKRPRPPTSPSHVDPNSSYAVCYVDDVNREMPGVEPGTVRYLRISERLQWFFGKNDNTGPIRWTPGTQHSRNFGYWTWSPTRVIGTVPVETDGSAYFKVPAGLAVYFQALDENMMEIRRMRSHVELKPGESRGCVGCHETKHYVPKTGPGRSRLALEREPSMPKPPPWGDVAILDYEEMIQPIFDRHCVRCHGATDPKEAPDLTDARGPHGFVQSYRSLFGIEKDAATPLGEGYREAYPEMPNLEQEESILYESVKKRVYSPGGLLCLSSHMSGPEVTQPKQFGSHRSRLVLTLLDNEVHQKDVTLSRDEWEALVTWVDANAPYHSTYFQYFDSRGKILPNAIRVRVELDPPFKAGEKTYRIVGT
jgi:hypothetical protein